MCFRRLKHVSILHRDAIRSGDREFSHCCRSPAADHARTRLERGSRASVQHMCGAIYSYGSRPRVQPLATALSLSRVRPYAEAAGKYPVDLLSAAARSLRCFCAPIPIRYLLIELLSAISAASAFWRFGASGQALAAYGLVAALLALAWIDLQTHLLPD